MRHKLMITGLVALWPGLALACPMIEINGDEKNQLLQELKQAPNERDGRAINNEIWRIWTTAPDSKSQSLLDEGRDRIRFGDYEGAEELLSELTEYCPHYAEGWNQRGFARFLRQDYGRALDDISQALEIDPRHYGAMAGRAVTLINMGRQEIGYTALREALAFNPWLSERHMLPPDEEL